jgi:uncharacterized secreted protein with C-terminal beta-propeller domain
VTVTGEDEDRAYVVHVMRDGGQVTTYTQVRPNIIMAIAASESEHKKVWGYHGLTIFAQDKGSID